MLMLRSPDPGPLPPTCTILGGVSPLPFPNTDGELFRTILMPGALLGVSNPALFALTDLLKRGASFTCSCLGGDDGIGASASSAWVTLENLISGGGSSSESLSSIPKLFMAGASAEKLLLRCSTDNGLLRRICGREDCATAAIMRFTCFPIQLPLRLQYLPSSVALCPGCSSGASERGFGPVSLLLLLWRGGCSSQGPWARSKYTSSVSRGGEAIATIASIRPV